MSETRRNWTEFEDRAIITLVKKHGVNNWADICTKMNTKYGIESRTGKQCRERWYNHLDPDINKNSWTPQEEKIMFEAHQQYGNKWTEISKVLKGRTDNDIKNHFYSMLRRSLRRMNKLLGMRDSTKKVRVIKPSVLSKLFLDAAGNTDSEMERQCKRLSEALFMFSVNNCKVQHEASEQLSEQERRNIELLIDKVEAYSQQHQHSLKRKKMKPRLLTRKRKVQRKGEETPRKKQQKDYQANQSITKQIKIPQTKPRISKMPKITPTIIRRQSNAVSEQVPDTELPKQNSDLALGSQFSLVIPEQIPVGRITRSVSREYGNSNGSASPGPEMQFMISPRWDIGVSTPANPTPLISVLMRAPSAHWKNTNEDSDRVLDRIHNEIARNSSLV